jgi:hypothetical protein
MGFSHYFARPKRLPARAFRAAAEDCRRVVEHLADTAGLVVRLDSDEPGPPRFGPDEVRFNGVGGDGHETFAVPRAFDPRPFQRPDRGPYFDFCKTARKPYDLAVCCCLIVFRNHFGERFGVSSDAHEPDDPANWPAARRACREALGYGADFALPDPRDFGRLRSAGLPMEAYRPPHEPIQYLLGNGWVMARRPPDRAVRVYRDRGETQLVCEAATVAEARAKATAAFLRERFAGAPGAEEFVAAFAATRDWLALGVFADRLADAGDVRERALRKLLPRSAAGSA